MTLPESFQQYGAAVFARNPGIVHEWSVESDCCSLSIPALSPNGFDIRFEVERDAITLYWGNWHTPFEPTAGIDKLVEDLFGLLRDMLSPDIRVRELCAGSRPYRGVLESYDGAHWTSEHEMALIFWNYVGKRSVRTYSNSILPARMSNANYGTAPDREQ